MPAALPGDSAATTGPEPPAAAPTASRLPRTPPSRAAITGGPSCDGPRPHRPMRGPSFRTRRAGTTNATVVPLPGAGRTPYRRRHGRPGTGSVVVARKSRCPGDRPRDPTTESRPGTDRWCRSGPPALPCSGAVRPSAPPLRNRVAFASPSRAGSPGEPASGAAQRWRIGGPPAGWMSPRGSCRRSGARPAVSTRPAGGADRGETNGGSPIASGCTTTNTAARWYPPMSPVRLPVRTERTGAGGPREARTPAAGKPRSPTPTPAPDHRRPSSPSRSAPWPATATAARPPEDGGGVGTERVGRMPIGARNGALWPLPEDGLGARKGRRGRSGR